MSNNPPELISASMGALVEPLHDAFEYARRDLDEKYAGLCDGEDQAWLRTHNLRGLTYSYLKSFGLPDRWSLTGNHKQNGAIHLAYGTGEIAMRFLHSFQGGAPAAGANRARRAFYTNRAYEEMSDPQNISTHKLILLWSEPGSELPFDLTLVRPLNVGGIRSRVKSDMSIPLPRVRTAFEELAFDTADDDELLEFEVDEKDARSGDDV